MATPAERIEAAGRLVAAIHTYLTTEPEPRHPSDGLPTNLTDIEAASDQVLEALIDCAQAGATLVDLQQAMSDRIGSAVAAGGQEVAP